MTKLVCFSKASTLLKVKYALFLISFCSIIIACIFFALLPGDAGMILMTVFLSAAVISAMIGFGITVFMVCKKKYWKEPKDPS